MLLHEIKKVQEGLDPINVFRDPNSPIIDTKLEESVRAAKRVDLPISRRRRRRKNCEPFQSFKPFQGSERTPGNRSFALERVVSSVTSSKPFVGVVNSELIP